MPVSVFGKTIVDYVRFVRVGLLILVGIGVARFIVGISGVPYERATHLVSITIVVFLAAIVYGQRVAAVGFGGYRHLVPIALLLGGTMYAFLIVAILIEGLGGIHGYFHSPGSGFAPERMALREHVLGQLSVMPTMTAAIFGVLAIGYALSRHLAFLWKGFLVLVAAAALRFVVDAIGGPGWLVSLLVIGALVAAYYGYRATSAGFTGYVPGLILGFMIAFVVFHLDVYGFVVSDALSVTTSYNEGVPDVESKIRASLEVAPLLVACLMASAALGLGWSKKQAAEQH